MTTVAIQDGKVVLRDGKVGTEQACCCGEQTPPECANDTECCLCSALIFDPFCGTCPPGWTKLGPFNGECFCVSPEYPLPCAGPQTAECAAIETTMNDAVNNNGNLTGEYNVAQGAKCCDGVCLEECPP